MAKTEICKSTNFTVIQLKINESRWSFHTVPTYFLSRQYVFYDYRTAFTQKSYGNYLKDVRFLYESRTSFYIFVKTKLFY